MSKLVPISALSATLVLAGCINLADYETTPVQVQTEQGTVVCQLYQHDQVIWDEAISAPAGMSIEQADNVCRTEGLRRIGREAG